MMNRDLAVVRDALHSIFQQAQGSCESTEELEELREKLASGDMGLRGLAKVLAEQRGKEQSAQLRQDGQGWVTMPRTEFDASVKRDLDAYNAVCAQRDALLSAGNALLGAMSNDAQEETKYAFEALRALIDGHWDRVAENANAQAVPSPPSGGG